MKISATKLPRKQLFDEKCFELARHFLPNAETYQLEELAWRLQTEVEDYCASIEWDGQE